MKKMILMAVLMAGTAFSHNASAATTTVMYGTFNINVSPDLGSGTFGTITITDLLGGSVRVTETITAPNFIINAGGHTPLTFNLVSGIICVHRSRHRIPSTLHRSPTRPFSNQLSFNAGIDGPGCTREALPAAAPCCRSSSTTTAAYLGKSSPVAT